MATTDYDFSLTRSKIIEGAFRKVGALTLGDSLSAEQMQQGVDALNAMVKEWQNQHIYLWTQQILTQAFTVGQASNVLSLNPAVLYVASPMRRENNYDTPLQLKDFEEYASISDKTVRGAPTTIFIDYKSAPVMYAWPVPDASYTIAYLATVRSQDWDLASGTGELPQRFLLALIYGLAAILVDDYPLPISEKNRIEKKAAGYLLNAKGSDRARDDSTFVKGAF